MSGFWLSVVLLVAACATAPQARGATLSVTGSGNPEFVLRQLAEAFNRSQSAHRVTIPASNGTAGAIRDLLEGTTVLGRVGRNLRKEELDRGLVFVPFGRDPVVFAGGAGTTVTSVTIQQMQDVFTGKIANWKALGGKPGPIRAIGREAGDASLGEIARAYPAFKSLVFSDAVKIVHLDPQMIELLDRYPGSLGFLNLSGLRAAKTRVRPLALEGVEPTPGNFAAGRYPLGITFGFIHRQGGLNDVAREFMKFVESDHGNRILQEHGVAPPPAQR